MIPSFAQPFSLPFENQSVQKSSNLLEKNQSQLQLSLEGKSFKGTIKAKGLIGFWGVEGVLSFADGKLIWSAKGSQESAPYLLVHENDMLKFSARLKADGGTFVQWIGFYNGKNVVDVQAKWSRVNEDDFIHDLFLPDIIELEFTPKSKH
ncbi:hypothetical protein [Litorilituus lipolyticus]|uniref:Uncharacterized protein n=1 Tax=Litorilituus lipolyticus TaxID=2491017 RepID=A0A502KU14_9GAMM|nr:hypothetical protein [Litorilituus lipolyticus]TPH13581.1 hypothetical protein EPA86_13340 [Litorilituus lipolyticus]